MRKFSVAFDTQHSSSGHSCSVLFTSIQDISRTHLGDRSVFLQRQHSLAKVVFGCIKQGHIRCANQRKENTFD